MTYFPVTLHGAQRKIKIKGGGLIDVLATKRAHTHTQAQRVGWTSKSPNKNYGGIHRKMDRHRRIHRLFICLGNILTWCYEKQEITRSSIMPYIPLWELNLSVAEGTYVRNVHIYLCRYACVPRVCIPTHLGTRIPSQRKQSLCSTAISNVNEMFSGYLNFSSFEMKETRCSNVQFCGVFNDAVSVTGIT
jgi:hypothetical protein